MYYTYLLKCNSTGQFYYGVSYRKDANPSNFWVTYFTSSKVVKQLIEEYGKESFDFEIRRIFSSQEKARKWEQKVLRRMHVVQSDVWLNRTDNMSFAPNYGDANHMKSEKSKHTLIESQNKLAIERGYTSYAEMISERNPAKNKEVADKIGNWKKGRIWVKKDGKSKMIELSELEKFLIEGYERGKVSKPCSEERKEKLRQYRRDKKCLGSF